MTRSAATIPVLLAVAAAMGAWAGTLPAVLAIPALAVTFLVTPGVVAVRWLLPDAALELRVGSALALAPFLSGGTLAALAALHVPLPVAARGVALVTGLCALALSARRATRPAGLDGISRVAWTAAAAWTLPVAAFLIGNPYLPPRADGWFHAAVTLQIVERGIPPEDPYFAGLRLLYFWGAHLWAAAWLALAPGLAVWTPLIAFNLASAIAVLMGVSALARRLGAGPKRVAFCAAVATLGYSPFTWLVPLARAMGGEIRGPAELARQASAGADAVLGSLAFGQLHASTAFFGDKFLVLTQFGLGLALVPLVVVALTETLARPSLRTTLALAALLGAALFLHTVAGYALLAVTGAVALLPARRSLAGDATARRSLLGLAAAAAIAAAILLPYLVEITAGKERQFVRGFLFGNVVTLVVGGALYLLPAHAWLLSRVRTSRDAQVVLVAGLVLLGFALGMRLPENNQSKFYNLAFVLFAAPAAFGWTAWLARLPGRGRALVAATLVAGTLPNAVFAFWGFALERGQAGLSWHPPTPAVAQAVAWARARTAPDAAFCDLGGGRELLDSAARSVIWGGYLGERDWGYPDTALAARRELAGALARGLEPEPAGARLLARLKRDVIVMSRASAPDSLSDRGRIAVRPERFALLWRNDEVSFWRVVRP